MPPYISIIIPVYNGVEFLHDSVESIVKQTYENWELIVAVNGHGDDGGSVAKWAETVANGDPRISILAQPTEINSKVKSINNAVEKSRGEWVSVLDVDDKWLPEKLQKQVDAIHGVARAAAVVGTFTQYFGGWSSEIPEIESGWVTVDEMMKENQVINSSALIHRSYAFWNYVDDYTLLEDYIMWLRILAVGGRIYNIPEVLTLHRVHPASAFNSQNKTYVPTWEIQKAFKKKLYDRFQELKKNSFIM